MKCPECDRETIPVACCNICHSELPIGDIHDPAELRGLIEAAIKISQEKISRFGAGELCALMDVHSYLDGDPGPLKKLAGE